MSKSSSLRRPLNISLPADLVSEAKQLGVNVSQACEKGLRATVKEAQAEAWMRENAEAIAAYNAHVEEHGLTFPEFRPVFD